MRNELLKRMWLLAVCVCVLAVPMQAADDAALWETKYAGDAAVGAQVLGLWQFDDPDELVDASGQGNVLKLRSGGRIVEDGRFGRCLESFTANVKNDKGQGAEVKNCPALNPTGAFTAEAWIKPKAELATHPTSFILDKKYFHYSKDVPAANTGYCWYLTRSGKGFLANVSLGFGEDSAWFRSTPIELKTDEWRHLAFTYNGAGTVHFFVDGKSVGRGFSENRGGITPSTYSLVLGDRYGSVHTGFPGFLDQVRITEGILPALRGSLEIQPGFCRTVYRRMEKDASIVVEIFNDTGRVLNAVAVTASLGADTQSREIPTLASGDTHTVTIPVDTSLRAGKYSLNVTAKAVDGARNLEVESVLPVVIVTRPTPNQMPVVMWGGGDNETLKDIGFTHNLKHMTDYARIWKAGEPTGAQNSAQSTSTARMLDQALADGLGACIYIYPGRWIQRNKKLSKYLRIDADGKPYSHENTAAAFPELKTFAYNCGASVAKTFGKFPALSAALVHSEIRDGTQLSYHDYEKELCKKELGFDMPLEAIGKGGMQYNTIAGFPADRVIPDDYKLLRFYKWFWKSGDGWNDLHTQTSRGLHSTGRDDIFTFFDPAVRVPSVWGSGGGVDVVSQWTYSYPDPLKIGQATDELFAMAKGQPGQKVMKMTQIIWYR
ncbi:MAG: LamG domain-containing protein, partial [Lentisphaeria bacterium]|nr:LamG domain-containing protein [Lentisphaeria bacterium]